MLVGERDEILRQGRQFALSEWFANERSPGTAPFDGAPKIRKYVGECLDRERQIGCGDQRDLIMYRERDVVRRERFAYGGILELLIERRAGRRVYLAHAELGGEYRQAVLRFAT